MKTPYNPDMLVKDSSPQRTSKLVNDSPQQNNDLPQASPLIQQLSHQLQNMQISNKMPQNNVTNLEINDQSDKLREITNNFPESQFSDYKFVFTVPQLVDPDPMTLILEPSKV